jgi:hypothetical protein
MVEGGTRAEVASVLSEKLLEEIGHGASSTFSASPFTHAPSGEARQRSGAGYPGWSRASGSSSVSTDRCVTPVSPKENVGLIITISIATCGLRTSRGGSSSKGGCSSTRRPRRRRVGSRPPRLSPPRRSVRPRPGPSFTRPGSPPEYSTLPPPAPRASRGCFDDEHFVHLEVGVPGGRDSSEDPSPLTVRRVVLIR